MAEYPGNSLKTGVKELLASGLYSDITIVCRGTEFKVHKLILHTQSPYFEKLFAGKFKEGASNSNLTRLELDEDPVSFAVLIKHLYHFTYDDTSRGDWSAASFAVAIYATADKYDVEPLRKQAAKRVRETLNPAEVADFVETIQDIDAYTVDRVLWEIILPVMKRNMSFLLAHKSFQELLLEKKDLNFRLLAMIDPSGGPSGAVPQTAEASESGEMDVDYHGSNENSPPKPRLQSHRHGLGRRLG